MNWNKSKWATVVLAALCVQAVPTTSQAGIPSIIRDDELVAKVDENFGKVVERLSRLEAQIAKLDAWSKQAQRKQDDLSNLTEDQRSQLEREANQLNGRSDQMVASVADLEKQLQSFKNEANAAMADMREALNSKDKENESNEQVCSGDKVQVELSGQEPFEACSDEQDLFEAGKEAWKSKQWQEAITLFSELRTTYPSSGYGVAALFYQASAHIELGNRAAGRVYMHRLKSQFPDHQREAKLLEEQLKQAPKRKVGKT